MTRRGYRGIPINTSKNTHETVLDLLTRGAGGTDRGRVVVDVPCGAGAFLLRLRDAGFTRVVGVDIVDQLAVEEVTFAKGDMDARLEIGDGSVDSLVSIDGIEHLRRPFDFIAEARRVLRDGGELILSTPNISCLRSRLRWLLTGHHHKCPAPLDERKPNPLHHINMISYPELRYLLHSNGFHITTVTANRRKAIAYASAPLALPAFLATWWTYRREARRTDTGPLAAEVRRTLFSPDILFGETCIIRALKQGARSA